jgi:hypothetical protein
MMNDEKNIYGGGSMGIRLFLSGIIFLLAQCATVKRDGVWLQAQLEGVVNDPETRFYDNTRKIPAWMLRKARKASEKTRTYDGVYKMVNPEEPFQRTCVIEEGLLRRRLVFMAVRKNQYLLCYERGGRGHNLLLSFAQRSLFKTNYYHFSFFEIPITDYHNLPNIKQAIQEKQFRLLYTPKKDLHFCPF